MPSPQPKHSYPVELYYVILAIAVLLTAFILYNFLINKDAEPAVSVPNANEQQLTEAEKYQISQDYSQNKADLSNTQKTRISGTYTQKSSESTLTEEEKAEIMKSYSR